MADITLSIVLKDLNIDKTVPAFLRYMPMPQIPDPEWEPVSGEEQPMVDKYPSVKKWAEAAGRINFYQVCIQRGQDLLAKDAGGVKLTEEEIFVID